MIIIPARLKSTRFPSKVIADVLGIPMVVRVANIAQDIDDVIVATDNEKVMSICKRHNIKAMMTSDKHNSGSDRVYEVCEQLKLNHDDLIINLQADEPFIEPEVISKLVHKTKNIRQDIFISSCFSKIDKESAKNSDLVKVVLDDNDKALYFSRALIPYDRNDNLNEYYLHLGIYGFNVKSLRHFCHIKPSSLETIEKLEQLRWLEFGEDIFMQEVESKSFGIDTKQDLEKAIKIFSSL